MKSYLRFFAVLYVLIGMFVLEIKAQAPAADPTKYEYAKELLLAGKNGQALEVLNSADIPPTAPFYWNSLYIKAVANYRLAKPAAAKEILERTIHQSSNWDGADEARFLLAQINFDLQQPADAIAVLEKISNSGLQTEGYALKKDRLKGYETARLKPLYEKFPYDKAVGRLLLGKLYEEGTWMENMALTRELEAQHNNKAGTSTTPNTPAKRDSYKVAFLLPFQEDKIDPNLPSGNFVVDLYEGMLLAIEHLAQQGINIEHFDYDTKRDSVTILSVLANPDVQKMDLIIGPLYANVMPPTRDFCKKYNIPAVNPISDNSTLIDNSAQSFLLLPSERTQAQESAKFAFQGLKGTAAYIIYGSGATDKMMADSFKEAFEKLGGTVKANVLFQANESAYSNLLKSLSGISKEPNAVVFVAGTEVSIASSIISIVQSQQPNAKIFAPQKWLEYSQLSLSRLEAANVHFYCQMLIEESSDVAQQFMQQYIAATKVLPSKFSYMGYEAMYAFGKALHDSQGNLVNKIHSLPWLEGKLFPKLNYSKGNDNSCVRIARFVEGQLQIVYSTLD